MTQTIESPMDDAIHVIRHDVERASELLEDALHKASAAFEPFDVAYLDVSDEQLYRYAAYRHYPIARLTIRQMYVELEPTKSAAQTLAALLREVADTIEKETT